MASRAEVLAPSESRILMPSLNVIQQEQLIAVHSADLLSAIGDEGFAVPAGPVEPPTDSQLD